MSQPHETPLKCHRCGSDALILNEVFLTHVRYDEGLIVTPEGTIRALGDGGVSTPGDPYPQMTEIECEDCGHSWRPRRRFAGAIL
jgi:hypothetical protein